MSYLVFVVTHTYVRVRTHDEISHDALVISGVTLQTRWNTSNISSINMLKTPFL